MRNLVSVYVVSLKMGAAEPVVCVVFGFRSTFDLYSVGYLQFVSLHYTSFLTLGVHIVSRVTVFNPRRACAARVTVVVCVCLSVCYSTSHFTGVRSSHKRYDLLNRQ